MHPKVDHDELAKYCFALAFMDRWFKVGLALHAPHKNVQIVVCWVSGKDVVGTLIPCCVCRVCVCDRVEWCASLSSTSQRRQSSTGRLLKPSSELPSTSIPHTVRRAAAENAARRGDRLVAGRRSGRARAVLSGLRGEVGNCNSMPSVKNLMVGLNNCLFCIVFSTPYALSECARFH